MLLVLAIATSSWYLYGNNRSLRSLVPFWLLIVALITKFAALALEFTDLDVVGDEFGVIPVLILIIALSGYLLFAKRELES